MQRLLQSSIHKISIIFFILAFVLVLTKSNPSVSNRICIAGNDVINPTKVNRCTRYASIIMENNFNRILKIFKQNFGNKSYYCLSLDDVLCFQRSFKSNSNISAIIQQGNHTPGSTTEGKLHIARHASVSLIGNSSKENVVLKGISLVLSEIGEIKLNNFTTEQSSLNVYGTSDPHTRSTITVENCTIIDSLIILTDVVLSVRDCEIKRCKCSAILSYSSFILFAGTVEFSDNTGDFGGALSLRGSRIQVVEDANVTFLNNNASVFGRAIFVDNADL